MSQNTNQGVYDMNRVTFWKILLIPVLVILSMTANSTVIYDESIDGIAPYADDSTWGGADVGTLLPGDNEILGENDGANYESYLFSVAMGYQVSSITVSVPFNTSDPSPYLFSWDLFNAPGPRLDRFVGENFAANAPLAAFSSVLPLTSAQYKISLCCQAEADFFIVTLTTEPVPAPEPTTLALLSLGLAGLGFTRRKMKG